MVIGGESCKLACFISLNFTTHTSVVIPDEAQKAIGLRVQITRIDVSAFGPDCGKTILDN